MGHGKQRGIFEQKRNEWKAKMDKKKKKETHGRQARGFTLRRLRNPKDLLRLLGNTLPAVVWWGDRRESLPLSSSWWRCLLLGTLRFLMRGGVRNARIGDDLRALVDCLPTDWSVRTEGDNELERSPSTCKAGFSDGNVASKWATGFLAAWFSSFSNSTMDSSRADNDWLRRCWRRRLPASGSETRNEISFNVKLLRFTNSCIRTLLY